MVKKKGLNDFRGYSSGVGTSYTDNIQIDIRNELGLKGRIVSSFFSLPLVNKIFKLQLKLTKDKVLQNIFLKNLLFNNSNKIKYFLEKYKIEDSTFFGCVDKVKIKNNEFSIHYLHLIERIDNIDKICNLNEINSIIEIGGGYGANIHLLLQNYRNLKKIIYVDIFPNIFVGTEYLKKFYRHAVKDYISLRKLNKIEFNKNPDELEIICVPPWSLDKINCKLDKFHNAASFQEMTIEQVKNYKNILDKILKKKRISILIYKGWEKNNTLSPEQINDIFDNKLIKNEYPVFGSTHEVFYLTS